MTLDSITRTIDRAFTAAGLDARAGVPEAVLRTVRGALASAGLAPSGTEAEAAPAAPRPGGQWLDHVHEGAAGRRSYRLYVPRVADGTRALPLVVMLHGCQQDPDDFARGTRMNEVADEQGFLVAYPAQSRRANGSNCWRWFEAAQQARGGAEPAIIDGIAGEVAARHRVDAGRVYAAGLSAGAAMAVILGQAYPERFAAVAAHSGLARGAARDLPGALAAMRGGSGVAAPVAARAVPTIVFHGDADATVAPANGDAIVRQVLAAAPAGLQREQATFVARGRRCTRTRHVDAAGRPLVEHWAVQGGAHAWFGGSTTGSFTSPDGPDASREIARFFALHARRAGA